jgi:hypothetical protein
MSRTAAQLVRRNGLTAALNGPATTLQLVVDLYGLNRSPTSHPSELREEANPMAAAVSATSNDDAEQPTPGARDHGPARRPGMGNDSSQRRQPAPYDPSDPAT